MNSMHEMPSGDDLRRMIIGPWDPFERPSGEFTGTELSQMYRARMGDYGWMYDKEGMPKAGWINLWTKKGHIIRQRSETARHRLQREAEERARQKERAAAKAQYAKDHPKLTAWKKRATYFICIGLPLLFSIAALLQEL